MANVVTEVGHNEDTGAHSGIAATVSGISVGDDIIIVAQDCSSATAATAPTDNSVGGNTYTNIGSFGFSGLSGYVYYCRVTNVMTTITYTRFTSFKILRIFKVTGMGATPFDKTAAGTATSTSQSTSNTATLTQADEFVMVITGFGTDPGTWTPGAGYTDGSLRKTTGTVFGNSVEWKTVAATTAVAGAGSTTNSVQWGMTVFTFKNGGTLNTTTLNATQTQSPALAKTAAKVLIA